MKIRVLSSLFLAVVAVTATAIVASPQSALGQPVSWFDSFEDGNATDGGGPFAWTESPGGFFPGRYDVVDNGVSKDYVFTTKQVQADFINETMVSMNFNTPFDASAQHVSIRTRGVLSAYDPNTGVGRGTMGVILVDPSFQGYFGIVSSTGNFELVRLDAGFSLEDLDPNNVLDPDDNPIGGTAEEMIIQIEVDGTNISATSWRPGTLQPTTPLYTVEDSTYTGLFGGLLLNENDFGDTGEDVVGTWAWAKTASVRLLDGDMEVDGDVDFDDIPFFVDALTNPAQYEIDKGLPPVMLGDMENDGDHDFDDIPLFVDRLGGSLSSSAASVPEPSTVLLSLVGLFGLMAAALRRTWSGR